MVKIGVIGGDGTGPEVIEQAVKVLTEACKKHTLPLSLTPFPIDGKRYLSEGKLLEEADLTALKTQDAVLLGAIGHPDVKPGILEKGILLKMRFCLDQYINLRPVKLYENVYTPIKNKTHDDIDYVVVRENTGGLYTGVGSFENKGTPEEVATQAMIYSRHQVERCVRYAYELAVKRHRETPWKGLSNDEKSKGFIGKLTLCGKTNVLTYVYDLWERVLHEVGRQYPTIKPDYVHVDAACIHMVERPEIFDVIVTGNMFGDIITDLAAVTQGGMGVAAGGNINPSGLSMFEPIGGTAPQFTGLNQINPMAAIGAAHMMMSHLGYHQIAQDIETAKREVILKMASMQAGKMGYSTTQIGDMVAERIQNM